MTSFTGIDCGVGFEYTTKTVKRIKEKSVLDNIRHKILEYIRNHSAGYELCLGGENHPMQVEIYFGDKDTNPALNEMYHFFTNLNPGISDVTDVRFLLHLSSEEEAQLIAEGKVKPL